MTAQPQELTPEERLQVVRVEADAVLSKLSRLLPQVAELTTGRQRRPLAVIPPETLEAIADQDRRERVELREAEIAGYPVARGGTTAPVNLSAVELHAGALVALVDWSRRFHRLAETTGVCLWPRFLARDVDVLVEHLRDLVWSVNRSGRLRGLVRDLDHYATAAERMLEGEDRFAHRDACPFCGRRSLVIYPQRGEIVCERPRSTDGKRPRCRCNRPVCACRAEPGHEHTWFRDTRPADADSWQSLASLLAAARNANPEETP